MDNKANFFYPLQKLSHTNSTSNSPGPRGRILRLSGVCEGQPVSPKKGQKEVFERYILCTYVPPYLQRGHKSHATAGSGVALFEPKRFSPTELCSKLMKSYECPLSGSWLRKSFFFFSPLKAKKQTGLALRARSLSSQYGLLTKKQSKKIQPQSNGLSARENILKKNVTLD